MNKNMTSFIINLTKLPNGYAFQSLQEPQNATNKKKNPPKQKSKNQTNRNIHRIFRELALDPQQPQQILNQNQEEPEPIRKQIQVDFEQQIQIQIKRQNGLPQSPARWFDQSSIHKIQRQSLPEFFDGRSYKSQGLYTKIRNFIVTLYRKNPAQYLTKIACRRILRGDVNTIMKIHSFLQREGIINFCVSKQGNYAFAPSIFTRVVNQQSKYTAFTDKITDIDEQKSTEPIDITNITVTTVNKCFSKSSRSFCSKCQSICGLVWYKKKDQAQKNYCLCGQCYQKLSQKQMDEFVKSDIIKKIQSGAQDSKAVWSIDDNLKLLQYASNPKKNWQQLQSSFEKKKTFDDVILQFMQFPIANFDIQKEIVRQDALKDSVEFHTSRLLSRLKKPKYQQKQDQQQNLTDENFISSMVKITKKLCQKFQTTINTSDKIEKDIDQSLFEIQTLKTLSSQKTKNQVAKFKQEKENLQNQQDQSSSRNLQQEQFNDNDQEQNDQENQNEKNDDLEDYINNLDYNQ